MKYKNLFLTIFSFCLLTSIQLGAVPDFLKPPPGDAVLSADEQAALEQTQQLYNLITKDMTPEARVEFDKAASVQYERLSQMTPEELEKEQQQVFDDLQNAIGDMEKKEAEEKAKVEVPQPVAPTPTPSRPRAPRKKIDILKDTLNTIIKRIDTLLLKTSRLLKLPQKIMKWVDQGQLSPWEPGLDWYGLKGKIQTFKQRLIKIKSHEKQRTYLDDIIENKELSSNLERLSDKLSMLESQFVVTDVLALDKQDLSSASKQAFKAIINNLLEALHTQKLIEALDAVMAKYDPEAEKLRLEREAKAEAARKFVPRPGPSGEVPTGYDVGPSPYYGGDYDYGYSPTTYDAPARRYVAPSRPTTRYQRERPIRRETRERVARDVGPSKDEKKRTLAPAPATDTRSTRLLGEISGLLDEVSSLFDAPALSNIQGHIASTQPPSIEVVNALNNLGSKIRRATSKVKFLGKNKTTKNTEDLEGIVNEHKENIDNFKNQLDVAISGTSDLHANKKYAYFGGLEDADDAIQQAIPSPTDIRKLRREIATFYEEAKKITK